jgi:hypothetical protein
MTPHDPKAIRVDAEQYSELQRGAGRAGHSAAEELRQRLAASFARDEEARRDPKLAELRDDIGQLASQLELDTDGPWHSDPFAFVAFRAGILALLETLRPGGDPIPPKGPRAFTKSDNPETVGREVARFVLRRGT